MVFRGRSPLCPPLSGKAIRVSFSTSPKTLFPRLDLAQVQKEAELSASGPPMLWIFSWVTLGVSKICQEHCIYLAKLTLAMILWDRYCHLQFTDSNTWTYHTPELFNCTAQIWAVLSPVLILLQQRHCLMRCVSPERIKATPKGFTETLHGKSS